MIDYLASKLAYFFVLKGVALEEDKDVYQYGIGLLFSTIFNIAIVLIISLFLRQFLGTVLFLLAFIPLRKATGGYHADSYLKCGLIFLGVYLLSVLLVSYIPFTSMFYVVVISSILSISLVLIYAPVEHKNKPLDIDQKKKLRKRSIILIFFEVALFFTGLVFYRFISEELYLGMMGYIVASASLIIAVLLERRREYEEKNEQNGIDGYDRLR